MPAAVRTPMPYTIAVEPDRVVHKNGEVQSFSARWAELAKDAGVTVRQTDVHSPHFFQQLDGCDGFMWRFDFFPQTIDVAKKLLPAVEHGLRLPVFPAWPSMWHFEDKVAQHYLLQAAGIPSPRTWVFFRKSDALEFCRTTTYPLVMKLALGIKSNNVRMLRTPDEAAFWVGQMFGPGRTSVEGVDSRLKLALRNQKRAITSALGRPPPPLPFGLQHGYFYVQEFLPDNTHDTRITVIGDRAFGFRRMNRPGDFRASGSGLIDWDPARIDLPTVRLAFRIARHLNTQSIAIDGLRRGEQRVVGEISYTYASWAVRDCPGHWVLDGDPETGRLQWVEGQVRPEDAIFQDFLSLLGQRRTEPAPAAGPAGAVSAALAAAAGNSQ